MKNRTDKILLAVFAVTLPLHIFIVLTYLEIITVVETWNWPYWAQVWCAYLALGFHVVPAFCLQLLLCRKTRRRVAAIPALVIVAVALCFTYGFFTATGWDGLGWLILLLMCIAPAVGFVLAWIVWFILKKLTIKESFYVLRDRPHGSQPHPPDRRPGAGVLYRPLEREPAGGRPVRPPGQLHRGPGQ